MALSTREAMVGHPYWSRCKNCEWPVMTTYGPMSNTTIITNVVRIPDRAAFNRYLKTKLCACC